MFDGSGEEGSRKKGLRLGKGFSVLSDEKNVTEVLNNDLKKAREQGYLSEWCLLVE